ncbi:LolA family protein [Sphingobacterium paludis]|jgi:outer membrane lipoprotein-sorting protein|uniref:Outer membrane lipoprotein carrier protein LolA n=1 Tax=Sphingobacterium paludis TaxID=1476465 RepID=A0A4R7D4H8_9SPHI|nr:outer membrane lipoprotein carrier protein LolA [Sphingobacterium paludis]TDS15979.1 outer membrane lipoprotein carrier protein LolA [Sphingobacterium paludis]
MRLHIVLFTFLLWTGAVATAQNDPTAKKLLDQVSKKYDAYHSIQSNFSFSMQPMQGDSYTDQGTLYLNKPKNQYRIQLNAQELISDGKAIYSILKDDKEVQVSTAEESSTSIGPNNLFTFYKSGFTYASRGTEKVGADLLNVVELSPIDSKNNYSKIKIRVNKNKHIHDVSIFDKSGARYTYTIKTLYVNHTLPTSQFTFNKSNYPGFEIVDLR